MTVWWSDVLADTPRGARTAITDADGSWSYQELATRSHAWAERLLDAWAGGDLDGARVAYRLPPGREHVAVQWGIWRAGGIAVPLALTHPARELAYVLEDADPFCVVTERGAANDGADGGQANAALGELAAERALPVLEPSADLGGPRSEGSADRHRALPDIAPDRPALMIYTSGTTGRPKGVVTTHANLTAQVGALLQAWGWSADDHILHVLPLHHIHGVVNVLSCALAAGARCTFAPFDARAVWEHFQATDLTLFMAVPTIYARLTRAWEEADEQTRQAWSTGARSLRLMVSGSAALPVSTLGRWRELTGHTLLERYGMTEIGMGLSNPLDGERRPGTVGQPLPGVGLRLVDEAGDPVPDSTPGQIQVRGAQVFREYWRRPEATRAAFDGEWFWTGDQAVVEDGYVRILGRRSVDILKTGGYKVSALEIEALLLERPDVREVAVVGVDDPEWGQRVCAAIVCEGPPPEADDLRDWARQRLAPYKVPREYRFVTDLPRNAMGKVVKPDVAALFES